METVPVALLVVEAGAASMPMAKGRSGRKRILKAERGCIFLVDEEENDEETRTEMGTTRLSSRDCMLFTCFPLSRQTTRVKVTLPAPLKMVERRLHRIQSV